MGRRIRAAREARDLTQADLATALGRTPTSVSYWEGGQRSPGLDDLVDIARVLGIDPATLLPSQPPRVLARAQAAELAIGDLVAVVDRIVDRFEQLTPLDPLPTFASANPVEVADTARRAAEQHKPPVRIEPVMAACNVRFTVDLCRRARREIGAGRYGAWSRAWISRYTGSDHTRADELE